MSPHLGIGIFAAAIFLIGFGFGWVANFIYTYRYHRYEDGPNWRGSQWELPEDYDEPDDHEFSRDQRYR